MKEYIKEGETPSMASHLAYQDAKNSESLDEKIVSLISQANFHYKQAQTELFKVGSLLDEIRDEIKEPALEKIFILDGLEMARKEGYYGYANGKFLKKE